MQGANRLPLTSGRAAASESSDEVRVGLREVASAAAATLTTFLDLQQALVSQHPGSSQSQVSSQACDWTFFYDYIISLLCYIVFSFFLHACVSLTFGGNAAGQISQRDHA